MVFQILKIKIKILFFNQNDLGSLVKTRKSMKQSKRKKEQKWKAKD